MKNNDMTGEHAMKYIIDTNALLQKPEILEEYDIIITSHVLREIEDLELKRRSDKQLQWEIRRLKRYMDENDHGTFDLKDYKFTLTSELDSQYVDNILLQVATDNGFGIISNDRLLREKCKMYGIETFTPNNVNLDVYQGYKFVDMTENEMSYFYGNLDQNTYGLLTNQYIIVRDKAQRTVDKYRWDGNKHVKLKLPRWGDKKKQVKPENDLQECALDLLANKDIPIKFILGTYGSGKTFLNTKVALHSVLEVGNQAKIMVVRNPIGTGEEIGFLKGDKDDKTAGFFKPIIQHLEGGELQAETMEKSGQLLKEIPYYMKGLSVDETFMLVDEAEDLNVKLIKLIGTRIGQNSVVSFSGDINQAEEKYIHDNGLVRAIEALKGKKEVGIVVLDIDVRSEASKLFADI